MEIDGQPVEDDFLFGAICNSTSIGGILTLDPKQVDMGDGLFEVLVPNKELENTIDNAVLSEEELADSASPELADLRRKINQAKLRVRAAGSPD